MRPAAHLAPAAGARNQGVDPSGRFALLSSSVSRRSSGRAEALPVVAASWRPGHTARRQPSLPASSYCRTSPSTAGMVPDTWPITSCYLTGHADLAQDLGLGVALCFPCQFPGRVSNPLVEVRDRYE